MIYPRVQYISQGENSEKQYEAISRALDAGCDWIQLRYKNLEDMKASGLAQKTKRLCESYQATFIVNDFPELVKEVDADGVHLGLSDLSVAEARRIMGEDKIIGGTANTDKDVLLRIKQECDYIGLGPYRFTSTKDRLSPILGIEGYRRILSSLEDSQKHIPIYAIGGIGTADIAALRAAEVYGVAVSGLITSSENILEVVKLINAKFHEKIEYSR